LFIRVFLQLFSQYYDLTPKNCYKSFFFKDFGTIWSHVYYTNNIIKSNQWERAIRTYLPTSLL